MKTVLCVTIDEKLFREIERLKKGNRSSFVEYLLRIGLRFYYDAQILFPTRRIEILRKGPYHLLRIGLLALRKDSALDPPTFFAPRAQWCDVRHTRKKSKRSLDPQESMSQGSMDP